MTKASNPKLTPRTKPRRQVRSAAAPEVTVIQVEHGVPLPPAPLRNVYPWRDLLVNSSFFIPNRNSAHCGSLCAGAAKTYGHTYTFRTVTENGVKGVRIWRVS